MSYRIVLSSTFKNSVQKLERRFRHVKEDVKIAVQTLLEMPRLGVVIPGGSGVRKLRVRNTDIQKGKRGGYRLLYYVENEPEQKIFLLLLYAKSDREDVDKKELEQLIGEVMQDMND